MSILAIVADLFGTAFYGSLTARRIHVDKLEPTTYCGAGQWVPRMGGGMDLYYPQCVDGVETYCEGFPNGSVMMPSGSSARFLDEECVEIVRKNPGGGHD